MAPLPNGEDRSLAAERADARHEHDDPHLRSCSTVTGYHIKSQDGEIGHVQGWLVDEETWAIRYIVVDTSNWWLGHKVLVAPEWIREVSWADSIVSVNMTQQAIRERPHPGIHPCHPIANKRSAFTRTTIARDIGKHSHRSSLAAACVSGARLFRIHRGA